MLRQQVIEAAKKAGFKIYESTWPSHLSLEFSREKLCNLLSIGAEPPDSVCLRALEALGAKPETKWALYGVFKDYSDIDDFEHQYDIVALFTTKEKAETYLKASKLKNSGHREYEVYRKKSLLHKYERAYVEEYCPEEPVVDPEL